MRYKSVGTHDNVALDQVCYTISQSSHFSSRTTNMATSKATAKFFTHGTCDQYEQVLKLYPQALKLKADNKAKKPEELIKLDNW